MVLVTTFPPVPRLSIVIPVGRDQAAFEKTLISVLENQPAESEIIVCHDGTYDDPFELAGEVRFTTGASAGTLDLIAAGATAAQGQFVHVLGGGLRATDGWTDSAVEKFEHLDAGVIAPVIRSATDREVMAGGWFDAFDRLCKANVTASPKRVLGAYLSASFWRRELIRSLLRSCDLRGELEATYAFELMSRQAGWRCVLATSATVLSDDDLVPGDGSSWGRGKRLRAIRACFHSGGWSTACKASVMAVLANVGRPARLSEAIGQSLAPTIESALARSIRSADVVTVEDDQPTLIHRLPSNTAIDFAANQFGARRAA